jgi:hypothetical protein
MDSPVIAPAFNSSHRDLVLNTGTPGHSQGVGKSFDQSGHSPFEGETVAHHGSAPLGEFIRYYAPDNTAIALFQLS